MEEWDVYIPKIIGGLVPDSGVDILGLELLGVEATPELVVGDATQGDTEASHEVGREEPRRAVTHVWTNLSPPNHQEPEGIATPLGRPGEEIVQGVPILLQIQDDRVITPKQATCLAVAIELLKVGIRDLSKIADHPHGGKPPSRLTPKLSGPAADL